MTTSTKLLFCMRRLPHLSHAQFHAYWRDVHAPIVIERAEILGIRRYTHLRSMDDNYSRSLAQKRGSPLAFDGVAELWFDARESPTEEGRNRARQANEELLADEGKFIDLAASPMFFVTQDLILEKDGNGAIRDFLGMRGRLDGAT